MPKALGPNGEIVYQLGAGDVIVEVLASKENYCEVAFGPADRAHAVGERCFEEKRVPEVSLVFPTPETFAIFMERLREGVAHLKGPNVFNPRMFS